jgi:hypothetical protein
LLLFYLAALSHVLTVNIPQFPTAILGQCPI